MGLEEVMDKMGDDQEFVESQVIHFPPCTVELRKLAKGYGWSVKVRDESDVLAVERLNKINALLEETYGNRE